MRAVGIHNWAVVGELGSVSIVLLTVCESYNPCVDLSLSFFSHSKSAQYTVFMWRPSYMYTQALLSHTYNMYYCMAQFGVAKPWTIYVHVLCYQLVLDWRRKCARDREWRRGWMGLHARDREWRRKSVSETCMKELNAPCFLCNDVVCEVVKQTELWSIGLDKYE